MPMIFWLYDDTSVCYLSKNRLGIILCVRGYINAKKKTFAFFHTILYIERFELIDVQQKKINDFLKGQSVHVAE